MTTDVLYGIVIIGTGAGGGTMAYALAGTGARILVVERGDDVPAEDDNWNPAAVWKDLRYRTTERWLDEQGESFVPYMHYGVGGNTKYWGSVLYRLLRSCVAPHADGRIRGFRALIPYARAKDYERTKPQKKVKRDEDDDSDDAMA